MPNVLLYDSCGCVTTANDWEALTTSFMNALGLTNLITATQYQAVGNALNAIVLASGVTTRMLVYKVGTPTTINTEQGYQQEVDNGDSLTLPEGVTVLWVRADQSPLEPIDSDYVIADTNLALIREIADANVYVFVTGTASTDVIMWVVKIGDPAEETNVVYNDEVDNGDTIAIPAGYDLVSAQADQIMREPIPTDYTLTAGVLTWVSPVEDANVYLLLKKQA